MESHMVAVHDLHANKLGYQCAGSYQQMAPLQANPSPDDNEDDDAMEATRRAASSAVVPPSPSVAKENTTSMNTEEALALLQAQGYTGMQPPKTAEQKLREDLEAKFAAQLDAQRQQFEASQQKLLETVQAQLPRTPAQRRTLVESTHTVRAQEPTAPPNSPRARRSHVQEALMNADWQQLADPSQPYPEGVGWQDVLKHFGRLMVMDYANKYGQMSIKPRNA
jgi:hypothetical protein